MKEGNINFAGASQVDTVIGKASALEGTGVVDAVIGKALVLEGDVNVPTITIQPGVIMTVDQSSISGPVDLIFGDQTLHIAAGHSLTHCTIEMVGDSLNITSLDGDILEM